MQKKKLFVANIPYAITEDQLNDIFEAAGAVESVKIIMDKMTGRSKGFAFIEMSSQSEAETAIETLNGHDCGGRSLKVDWATSRN